MPHSNSNPERYVMIATAICREDPGLLYLLRDGSSPIWPNMLGMPSGRVDTHAGETPFKAALRELQEGTGIIAADNELKIASMFTKRLPVEGSGSVNMSITVYAIERPCMNLEDIRIGNEYSAKYKFSASAINSYANGHIPNGMPGFTPADSFAIKGHAHRIEKAAGLLQQAGKLRIPTG